MSKPHQAPQTTSPPRSVGEVGAPRGAPGEGQSFPVERKAPGEVGAPRGAPGEGQSLPVERKAPANLFGLDRTALRARFAEMGEAPFRADQVMNWIYRRGVD